MASSKHWSCDISQTLDIQLGSSGFTATPPQTAGDIFREAKDKFPDRDALAYKDGDSWLKISYSDYYKACIRAAKSFIKLGVQPLHGVAITGFNSPEWVIANNGAIFAGGVSCGMYPTNSAEVCEYIMKDSKANVAIVEDQRQLDKILKIRGNLPQLKAIVQYKGKLSQSYPDVYDWEQFLQLGNDIDDKTVEDIISAQKPENVCTLIYTSGTTGEPKGVMLTHDNLVWTSKSLFKEYSQLSTGTEIGISYLPLSHIAAQICDIWAPITFAFTIYFAQPDALKGSLGGTLLEVKPTMFVGVPRVWEKFKGALQKALPPTEVIKSLPEEKKKQVQMKAKAALGLSNCKLAVTAAAPVSKEVLEFFFVLDFPLWEVWGMSEGSGPGTTTAVKDKLGSIGKPFPGIEVKIDSKDPSEEGEICFRGRCRMNGYLNKREKTSEAIDDEGWMHSGDVGRMDKDGNFYITGRIKELIITSGAENVAPVPIEDRIKKQVPFLSNVMVVGDHRNYLTCLVTMKCVMNLTTGQPTDDLDPEAIASLSAIGCSATTVSAITSSKNEQVFKAIQDALQKANEDAISNAQKVQKFHMLNADFSLPGGELGPTLKLKRFFVLKKYATEIDSMYA